MEVKLPTRDFLKLMKNLSDTLEEEIQKQSYYLKFIRQCQRMLYPLNQERKAAKKKYVVQERHRRIQVNTKIGFPNTMSLRTYAFNDTELLSVMKNKETSLIVSKLLQQDSKRELWQDFCHFAQKFHKDLHNQNYKEEKKEPITITINTYDGPYQFITRKCYLPGYDTIQFIPHHPKDQPDPAPSKTQGDFNFRILNYFGQLHYDFQRPSMDINILQIINRLNQYFDIAQIFREKITKEREITAQNKSVYEKFKEKYIARLMADAI